MVYLRIDELLKEKQKRKYWLVKNMEGSWKCINNLITNEVTSIHFSTIDKLCSVLECQVGDLFKKI